VDGAPRAGGEPSGEHVLARSSSAPLADILRRQNLSSVNLDAEVLNKMLGGSVFGAPGSTAKGARAIRRWARRHGVRVVTRDGSGLSYGDGVSTDGLVRLLAAAGAEPWVPALRASLPSAGEGTLSGRLAGLRVRAKTGTLLREVSALSGWVRLRGTRRWAEFSVLSRGLPKWRAVAIEDRLATIIAR
jgi:D-alanyl-D-alanine carboxypeptidase/D-alanyl-D-alanine-endopeptidase (penicillin-binding protein 4)